jgi:hypothetical protein
VHRAPSNLNRTLRNLLVALALLFSQQAAQVHALSHLDSEFAGAQRQTKGKFPVSHPAAQCLLFHAIDCAPPPAIASVALVGATLPSPLQIALPLPLQTRIEFDSRAPPVRP